MFSHFVLDFLMFVALARSREMYNKIFKLHALCETDLTTASIRHLPAVTQPDGNESIISKS